MLLSSENINNLSFPLPMDLPRTQAEPWVWPQITFRFGPAEGWTKFLRYPGPRDGVSYRVMRSCVIFVLRVNGCFGGRRAVESNISQ